MRAAPDCADCDTYALVTVMCRPPARQYAFWLEMVSALIVGWWIIWQVAIR